MQAESLVNQKLNLNSTFSILSLLQIELARKWQFSPMKTYTTLFIIINTLIQNIYRLEYT